MVQKFRSSVSLLCIFAEFLILLPANIPAVAAASSLSFAEQDHLTQSAFYEENGTLKPTDTTLHATNDSFRMQSARYKLSLSKDLVTPNVAEVRQPSLINIDYNNLVLSLTPLNTQPSTAHLIQNGKEVDGKDNPSLQNKGLVYPNAYGTDTSLGIIADPLDVRKIVKIDNKEAMQRLLGDASTLDLPFQLSVPTNTSFSVNGKTWDKKAPLIVTNKPIKMQTGDTESYIQPAKVWDSNKKEEAITLTLKQDDQGHIILTKHLSTDFLTSAAYPVYTDATISFGSETGFNAAVTSGISIVSLDSTHVVIVYEDSGDSDHGNAVVGTISGTSISFGTEATFNSGTTNTTSVSALDSTHVVVVYDDASDSDNGNAVVGTISGTNISFGSEYTYNAGGTSVTYVTTLDSTHVVVAFRDSGDSNHGNAVVGTISGTTISFGTEATFNGVYFNFGGISTLDSTHVAIAYQQFFGADYVVVGTISGTNISFGTQTTVISTGTNSSPSIATLDSTHVVIAYEDSSNSYHGYGVVGTISAGTVSLGTKVVFYNGSTSGVSVSTLDSTHVAIAYIDGSSHGAGIVGTISGTNISFNTPTTFKNTSTSLGYIVALDSSHVAIAYSDASSHGIGIVGTVSFGFNLSGTVYTDEGHTTMGAGKTVSVSINGAAAAASTTTASDGTFTLSSIATTAGDVLTIYLDNNTEKAVTVTVATGADQSGLNLYQNRLITRCDNSACALTNANLATAATNADTDITSIYTVNSSVLHVKAGKALTVAPSQTFTPGNNVTVGSGVTINGTLSAGSNTLTLSGTFLKASAGTFTAGTSTVVLNGTNQTLSGSTTFYNLSKTVASAATLTFAATTTQTISNTLTLQGAASNLLSLRSSQTGTQWKINPQSTRTIAYLDIKDSNNTNATHIDCTSSNCTDSGNNTNWFFTSGITLTSGSNPSLYGSAVTFTITVSPSTATGTVTLKDDTLSRGIITLSHGSGTVTTTFVDLGTHTMTAVYSGNASYAAVTSNPLTQTVTVIPSSDTSSTAASSGGGGGGGRRTSSTTAALPVTPSTVITTNTGTPAVSSTLPPALKQMMVSMRARLADRIEKRIAQFPSLASLLNRVLQRLDARIAGMK